MKKLLKDPVCHIAYKGIKGAVIGIFAGLVLGVLIWGLLLAVDYVFPVESSFTTMPASSVAFLGMGFGAVLGGIFGACACLKERLKEKK